MPFPDRLKDSSLILQHQKGNSLYLLTDATLRFCLLNSVYQNNEVVMNVEVDLRPRPTFVWTILSGNAVNESSHEPLSCVYETTYEILPCDEAPQSCPGMYERNPVHAAERDKWQPRINMFETAYQTEQIFAISIVPKNPSMRQTWYQKRILKTTPDYFFHGSTSTKIKHSECFTRVQTDEQMPIKQPGFIEPFSAFSSAKFGADPTFSNSERVRQVWLQTRLDVENALVEVGELPLKTQLTTILTHFLIDTEAKSVGLIFRNGEQLCYSLFHK